MRHIGLIKKYYSQIFFIEAVEIRIEQFKIQVIGIFAVGIFSFIISYFFLKIQKMH